jgi:hypothetical protein
MKPANPLAALDSHTARALVRYGHDQFDNIERGFIMGFMDSIKSKLGGNKAQVKGGIDKVADVAKDKAGGHADKVEQGAEAAKDAVDKLPDA